MGAMGAKGSQLSTSYAWVPRGRGARKSSRGFSRQTLDLQLAAQAPESSVSGNTWLLLPKSALSSASLISKSKASSLGLLERTLG